MCTARSLRTKPHLTTAVCRLTIKHYSSVERGSQSSRTRLSRSPLRTGWILWYLCDTKHSPAPYGRKRSRSWSSLREKGRTVARPQRVLELGAVGLVGADLPALEPVVQRHDDGQHGAAVKVEVVVEMPAGAGTFGAVHD